MDKRKELRRRLKKSSKDLKRETKRMISWKTKERKFQKGGVADSGK